MIVRPYIRVGFPVVYSPPDRDDVSISVVVYKVVGKQVIVEFADETLRLVDVDRLSPMPEVRMKPTVSIVQVVDEFEANGGDVNRLDELKRKHKLG